MRGEFGGMAILPWACAAGRSEHVPKPDGDLKVIVLFPGARGGLFLLSRRIEGGSPRFDQMI
jgi:hypothetical protein